MDVHLVGNVSKEETTFPFVGTRTGIATEKLFLLLLLLFDRPNYSTCPAVKLKVAHLQILK